MWRSAQAALLALFVTIATFAGGSSYLFCSMTDSVVSRCCCEADEDDHSAQAEVQRTSDCCATKSVDKLPQGFGNAVAVAAATPTLAAPIAVAVVAAPAVFARPVTREPTGPPRERRRAQIQVFLL